MQIILAKDWTDADKDHSSRGYAGPGFILAGESTSRYHTNSAGCLSDAIDRGAANPSERRLPLVRAHYPIQASGGQTDVGLRIGRVS